MNLHEATNYFLEDTVRIPRELYHGSRKEFSSFSLDFVKSGEGLNKYGRGIYLTDSTELAKYYAGENGYVYTVSVPSSNLTIYNWDEQIDGSLHGSVVAFLRDHDDERNADEMEEDHRSYGDFWTMNQLYDWLTAIHADDALTVTLLAECGCDGVKADDIDGRGTIYVVFDPSVIKILDTNFSKDY